jgi:hypothetical protein
MCSTIFFRDRKALCISPRELAAQIGGEANLIWLDGAKPHQSPIPGRDVMDCCLCPVDIAASIAAAGLRAVRVDRDEIEYVVEQAP